MTMKRLKVIAPIDAINLVSVTGGWPVWLGGGSATTEPQVPLDMTVGNVMQNSPMVQEMCKGSTDPNCKFNSANAVLGSTRHRPWLFTPLTELPKSLYNDMFSGQKK